MFQKSVLTTELGVRYQSNIAFKDIKTFYKQLTVNYLLNPENWTRPKVNTERSQMNNRCSAAEMCWLGCTIHCTSLPFECVDFAQVGNNCFRVDKMKQLLHDIHIDIALKASGRDCTNNNELLHKIGVLQRFTMQYSYLQDNFYKRFHGAVSITVVLKESDKRVEGSSPIKTFSFFIFFLLSQRCR